MACGVRGSELQLVAAGAISQNVVVEGVNTPPVLTLRVNLIGFGPVVMVGASN